jgi:hypothetical protein
MTILLSERPAVLRTGFLERVHYVRSTVKEIAAALGGTITVDDCGDGCVLYNIAAEDSMRDGFVHITATKVEHDGVQAVILDFMPGYLGSPLQDRVEEIYGDTSIPQSLVTALIAELEAADALTTRTVLIADEAGTDAVAVQDRWWMQLSLSAEVAGTDTPVTMQCFSYDPAVPIDALPADGVRLGRRTYPTIVDLARADKAEMMFLGLSEHLVEDILQQHAIGVQHVYGILDGPLDTSQSVMSSEFCRHEGGEKGGRFIGQFKPAGAIAEFLFMVTETDGVITSSSHAL